MTFSEFLEHIDPRFLQEREVGLDLYLSGVWAWIPIALGIAAATVFLLALFHVVPSRRHSVPILLALAVVGLLCGLAGTFLGARGFPPPEGGPLPAVFTEGRGRRPETLSQQATLIALPLLAAGMVCAAAIAGAVFLLIFGGRDRVRGGGDDEDE